MLIGWIGMPVVKTYVDFERTRCGPVMYTGVSDVTIVVLDDMMPMAPSISATPPKNVSKSIHDLIIGFTTTGIEDSLYNLFHFKLHNIL